MRSFMLIVWIVPFLAGCTANSHDGEVAAPSSQPELARTRSKAPTVEMVHQEPADHKAPAAREQAPTANARIAARTAEKNLDIVSSIDFEAQGAPAGTNALGQRLLALHPEGIPDRDALVSMPKAAEKLLFIESNAALFIQRQRALTLMRDVYTDAVRARLLRRASDSDLPVGLRAAALRSLKSAADSGDAASQKVLAAAQHDDNVRIRRAAGENDKPDRLLNPR